MKIRIPITDTELAFVVMIQEEHAALIRQADTVRKNRIAPLLKDKQIPDGRIVSMEPKTAPDQPAHLVYDDGTAPPKKRAQSPKSPNSPTRK